VFSNNGGVDGRQCSPFSWTRSSRMSEGDQFNDTPDPGGGEQHQDKVLLGRADGPDGNSREVGGGQIRA